MNNGRGIVRIAHAWGNTRAALERALAAPVDMIEVDIWHRSGRIEVRHERRLGPLPLLADRRGRALHATGRLRLPLWSGYYLRPDIGTMDLRELLERTAAKKRLLLDVKARRGESPVPFVNKLTSLLAEQRAQDWVAVCGQYWPVIREIRSVAPGMEARYSMERRPQWERFVEMAAVDPGARMVCIEHRFLDAEKADWLEEHGADVYCWTVDDAAVARGLVSRGVDGIISNDLDLLASLQERDATGAPGGGSGVPPSP